MKILNISECNSHNLGDQLISICSRILIEQYLCQRNNVILIQSDMTNAELVKEIKNSSSFINSEKNIWSKIKTFVPGKLKWLISRTAKVYKITTSHKFNGMFIGGGQIILGGNVFPISLLTHCLFFKAFNGSKIVLFNVGCANRFSIIDKLLITFSLKFIDSVLIRDKQSLSNFDKNFSHNSMELTLDPVFLINELNIVSSVDKTNNFLVFPASYERVYLKYNSAFSYDEYIDDWCHRIQEANKVNRPVYIMCSDLSQDENVASSIKQKLEKIEIDFPINYIKIDSHISLTEFISSAEVVLSARMHPLIISCSFDVNTVLVYPISNKLIGFENEFLISGSVNRERRLGFVDSLNKLGRKL